MSINPIRTSTSEVNEEEGLNSNITPKGDSPEHVKNPDPDHLEPPALKDDLDSQKNQDVQPPTPPIDPNPTPWASRIAGSKNILTR